MQPIGDRAGEWIHMERGRYSAWAYVVIAFIYQMLILGGIGALCFGDLGESLGGAKSTIASAGLIAGVAGGLLASYLVFRDRWKCTEAFSSRFCSGIANLSMLYVPVVALVYANVRGIKKLKGG